MKNTSAIPQITWLNPLKAFALLAILLNHLVEEFGTGTWFTNPSDHWPDFATRMTNLFPQEYAFPVSLIQFLGWLGDSGPGVFLFASGFGLTWAALHKSPARPLHFYTHRLLRIFPLYIAMHFIVLTGSLGIPSSTLTLADPLTFLSLVGLRFTDSLFFYINPSWWFIWLILQLYVIFPFLYAILHKFGIKTFLVITCAFTILSRLLGLVGIRYSQSLYYWMTGIFFGTRLAEFGIGMVLAALMKPWDGQKKIGIKATTVFVMALPTYLLGLASSLTLPGSMVANFLVTIGLCGIFYAVWELCIKQIPLLAGTITWLGAESYGIYLLHQPPLKWTKTWFTPGTSLHLLAALLVVGICLPVGWFINTLVSRLQRDIRNIAPVSFVRVITWIVNIGVLAALVVIEPQLWDPWKYRVFSLLLGLCMIILWLSDFILSRHEKWFERLVRWALLCAAFLQLFVLTPHWGTTAVLLGAGLGVLAVLFSCYDHSTIRAWIAASIIGISSILGLEFAFRYYAPLEAGRWGEFPALQTHPTRIYALTPNQVTHLKYNNYDYVLRTNSLGLASPEIGIERLTPDMLRILVIGDAFSMPEGMEYEDAYPALVETELRTNFPQTSIQVINAGITGYGPVEQYPQLQELAPLLKPDIVIYEFFMNEFQEVQITPEARLTSIGLLPEHTSIRRKFFEEAQILAHSRKLSFRLEELFTGKPAQWRYEKSLLRYYVTGENSLYLPENLAKIHSYLSVMNDICQDIGSVFIVYFVPGAEAVSKPSDIEYFPWDQDLSDTSRYDLGRPFRNLQQITAELEIPVVDLTPYLKAHPSQPVYFPGSWHWNKEGHKAVAEAIVQDLADRDLLNHGDSKCAF